MAMLWITAGILIAVAAAATYWLGRRHGGAGRNARTDIRFVAEHIGDTVLSVAADGGARYVSPTAARIFGVGPAAIVRDGIAVALHPDDRAAEAKMRENLLTGLTVEDTQTFRVMHPTRGMVWLEMRARRRLDLQSGAVDGYTALLRDVTARRAIEQVHGNTEQQNRLLAENTSDAVTCLNLDLTHNYVSPTFSRLFGYRAEQVLGEPRSRIVHADDLTELYQRLGRLAAGDGDRAMATYRMRHASGHFIWVESNFCVVRNEATGRPESIICSVRDVSERRAQAEALLALNADLHRVATELEVARDRAETASLAKTRFLASVSHELRTPMNGILGYAELLRGDGRLAADQRARVDSMLSAGQHLLDMINTVLDLSEIEAGKLEIHPSPVDLRHVAAGSIDWLRPAAQAKGLAIEWDIAPNLPRYIVSDGTRLRQVLLNLLGNAVKFTAVGGATLSVTMGEPGMFRVHIADTGPGIPPELRGRLFQDFDRLGVAATSAIEGTGLGLALSARLVALMGGRIGHSENPAGGSIFWVEFPLREATAQATTAQDAPDAGEPRLLRLLVVDDVAMNRDVAASFLRAAGHEVTLAEDGGPACAMAEAHDYDVILMDVRMPGMDGLEATRRIRRLTGPRGTVPIMALTAQAFAEQVQACRQAGMDSHLAKPFKQRALLTAVQQAASSRVAAHPDVVPAVDTAPDALPVLDHAMFAEVASFLSAQERDDALRTVTSRAQALLRQLREADGAPEPMAALAAVAHRFGGSAFQLGFTRAGDSAVRLEAAATNGDRNLTAVASQLSRDLETMLMAAAGMEAAGQPAAS